MNARFRRDLVSVSMGKYGNGKEEEEEEEEKEKEEEEEEKEEDKYQSSNVFKSCSYFV